MQYIEGSFTPSIRYFCPFLAVFYPVSIFQSPYFFAKMHPQNKYLVHPQMHPQPVSNLILTHKIRELENPPRAPFDRGLDEDAVKLPLFCYSGRSSPAPFR